MPFPGVMERGSGPLGLSSRKPPLAGPGAGASGGQLGWPAMSLQVSVIHRGEVQGKGREGVFRGPQAGLRREDSPAHMARPPHDRL